MSAKKVQPKPQAQSSDHVEPENPIVIEREPEASAEVVSGREATDDREREEYTVPVVTETAEAQFRIVNH